MKEPVPGRIGPPNSGVPLLKVGVVLEEDEKTTISFQVQEPIYVASCGDRSIPLEPKREYLIEHDSGSLALYLENTLLFPSSDTTIAVSAEQELELAPHSGIRANGLVAGRSFHWKKTIEQTFPGSLNFLPGYSSIVAINEVEFEDYLACVISSEMSSQCPAEFVKAQATAARCWAYVFLQNKHPEAPFDICNDDDCQRYQGTGNLTQSAISAVRDSRGLFVLDASQNVCPTYYSKSCGGVMEGSQTAFGFEVKGLCDQLDGSGVTPLDLTIEEGGMKGLPYLILVDELKAFS